MFAAQLKKIREERELSQLDLARLSGLSPAVISMFETNKRQPCLPSLIKVRDALQSSYDVLISGYSRDFVDDSYHLKTLKNRKILDGIYEILKQTEE